MPSRPLNFFVLFGLIVAMVLAGCAKPPQTASLQPPTEAPKVEPAMRPAPAPTLPPAPPGPVARPPEPTPPVVSRDREPPRQPPRPEVKEFKEVFDVKRIYFDFDKYDIRPEDAKTLDANAQWLKGNDNLVLIEGHCDERGTNEYNLALGERRAKAAMNYLVAQGVQAARITILSYGEERPICTEQNESCWSKNRRAAFLVKPR